MLESPFQFRSPNANPSKPNTPPPTLRKTQHQNTTSPTDPMDPQHLSRMLGGTAAYPSLFNSQSNHIPPPNPLTPPSTFPRPIPSPYDLPLRIPPSTAKLAELDEVFNSRPHILLGTQGVRDGYDDEKDENKSKAALRELERHIADRTPYVQLASSRLHAAMGVRNENPFDLPGSPARHHIGSTFHALYSDPGGMADGGRAAVAAARNGGRKDSGVGLGVSGLGGPLSPRTVGMHVVDKETGKGLREFLLQKGKEQGHVKRECRGISFHDFTPDIRSMSHSNVLLGHFGVEGSGERVDVYEVDLPTITIDPETGMERQTNEPWIWILISRPMVTFDPTSKSTMPPPESLDLSTPASDSTTWYTPQGIAIDRDPQAQILHPTPPPNFLHPIPLSWLVFAAPLAHVTAYPELTESLPTPPSPYPLLNSLTSSTRGKMIQKRKDYDFSHSGIPIFEFSSASIFSSNTGGLDFLSVDGIGPWYVSDPYDDYSEEEYLVMMAQFERECVERREEGKTEGELIREDFNRCGEFDVLQGKGGKWGMGKQSPNRGVWWREFYRLMYVDAARWRAVKRAMGTGKCRVVVRWAEWEGGVEDADMERFMEAQGGNANSKGRRVTRSEGRRRSGLGMGEENAVIGGGLPAYDSSISRRVVGNAQVGGGKEKGKGVKKR